MFKNILVPLDGSNLSESVLPAVNYWAKVLDASVTLVHVIEKNAPKEIHGERHLSNSEEAESYLRELSSTRFGEGIKIEYHVHTAEVKDVAKSIVQHMGEFGSDLAIMCSHGKVGMRKFIFGSIAQQVISLGRMPVMVFQPDASRVYFDYSCRRILVPVDGQREHQGGLEKARILAKASVSELEIVMVVETFQSLSGQRTFHRKLMPGTTAELLDIEEQNANIFLEKIMNDLEKEGLVVMGRVLRDEPSKGIMDTAELIEADLIVLGTHAKPQMDAFWSGSMAPKIGRKSGIPLLLVPVS